MAWSGSEINDINNESSRAIKECLASRTVIITSETQGFPHGTGIAVRHGHHDYILTAAHVLEKEPDNDKIRVVSKPDGPQKEVEMERRAEAVFTGSHGRLTQSNPTRISIVKRFVGRDKEDIAALKIQDAASVLPNTDFYDLSGQGETQILEGEEVLFFGFPGALALHAEESVTRNPLTPLFPYVAHAKIRNISDVPRNYGLDPDVHFVTDYIYDDQTWDPKGMSGCGVWSIPRVPEEQIWSPHKNKLLGIQWALCREPMRIVIVRIQRVLDLLSNEEGESCATLNA